MKRLAFVIGAILIVGVIYGVAIRAEAKGDPKADITALENALAAAVQAKDLDKTLSYYEMSDRLLLFDAIPPRQYAGADAVRKDFKGFYDNFVGPIKFELTDLQVMADARIGFAHSIQHVSGAGKDGKQVDMTFRVTDCLRKIGGKWKIVHQHISFPVDIATGKADMQSKP
jgi:ketosteroid isomerase-like protein